MPFLVSETIFGNLSGKEPGNGVGCSGGRQLVKVIRSPRFETYLIPAPAGKGSIVLNGATAHLGKKGDLLTIMAFAQLTSEQIKTHRAKAVVLGPGNKIEKVSEITTLNH